MPLAKDLIAIGFDYRKADFIGYTMADALTATGTTQGTAYVIDKTISRFTTVTSSNYGAKLPIIEMWPNAFVYITNDDATDNLSIYPGVGEYIGGGAVNTAIIIKSGNAAIFLKCNISGTQRWVMLGSGGELLPLFDHFADAGNVGTGEDDLYSDTLAASTLATEGDKIIATYGGIFVGAAAATQQLKVYFGGTQIYASGALAIGVATNNWTLNVTVIRESSSVVRCTVSLSTDFATLFPYSTYTRITGLTLTNTQILKLTGEAAGAGAADNQIVSKLGHISKIGNA